MCWKGVTLNNDNVQLVIKEKDVVAISRLQTSVIHLFQCIYNNLSQGFLTNDYKRIIVDTKEQEAKVEQEQ